MESSYSRKVREVLDFSKHKNHKTALVTINKVLKKEPFSGLYLVTKALVILRKNKGVFTTECSSLLLKILEPNVFITANTMEIFSSTCREAKEEAFMVETLQKMMDVKSDIGSAYIQLMYHHLINNEFEEMTKVLGKAQQKIDNPEIRFCRIISFYLQSKFGEDEASRDLFLKLFVSTIERFMTQNHWRCAQEKCFFILSALEHTKNYELILKYHGTLFNDFMNGVPNDVIFRQILSLIALGRYPEAEEVCFSILRTDFDCFRAHNFLLEIYKKRVVQSERRILERKIEHAFTTLTRKYQTPKSKQCRGLYLAELMFAMEKIKCNMSDEAFRGELRLINTPKDLDKRAMVPDFLTKLIKFVISHHDKSILLMDLREIIQFIGPTWIEKMCHIDFIKPQIPPQLFNMDSFETNLKFLNFAWCNILDLNQRKPLREIFKFIQDYIKSVNQPLDSNKKSIFALILCDMLTQSVDSPVSPYTLLIHTLKSYQFDSRAKSDLRPSLVLAHSYARIGMVQSAINVLGSILDKYLLSQAVSYCIVSSSSLFVDHNPLLTVLSSELNHHVASLKEVKRTLISCFREMKYSRIHEIVTLYRQLGNSFYNFATLCEVTFLQDICSTGSDGETNTKTIFEKCNTLFENVNLKLISFNVPSLPVFGYLLSQSSFEFEAKNPNPVNQWDSTASFSPTIGHQYYLNELCWIKVLHHLNCLSFQSDQHVIQNSLSELISSLMEIDRKDYSSFRLTCVTTDGSHQQLILWKYHGCFQFLLQFLLYFHFIFSQSTSASDEKLKVPISVLKQKTGSFLLDLNSCLKMDSSSENPKLEVNVDVASTEFLSMSLGIVCWVKLLAWISLNLNKKYSMSANILEKFPEQERQEIQEFLNLLQQLHRIFRTFISHMADILPKENVLTLPPSLLKVLDMKDEGEKNPTSSVITLCGISEKSLQDHYLKFVPCMEAFYQRMFYLLSKNEFSL